MERWQEFATGYRNIDQAVGNWWPVWRALWIGAGALFGIGFVTINLACVLLGVLLLVILTVRCFDCADVVVALKEPSEHEAEYDPLASVRTAYDPPSRVLGPHHEGVDL